MTAISAALRTDLSSVMPIEQVFQKHLIDGSSYFFRDHLKEPDYEYELRHKLSEVIQVSINDVVLIGSAKLGFSVKSASLFPFDYKFSQSGNPRDKSDIDVAVVNKRLFDTLTERIFNASRHFDANWINQYWRMNLFNNTPKDLFPKYTMYLARGWLRPDLMPGPVLARAEWVQVCEEWYKKIGRKISVGFYSDWYYLKHYQMDNLMALKIKVRQLEV